MTEHPDAFTRTYPAGPGLRVVVKDIIDMKDEITGAGCRAMTRSALPAAKDADCLTGIRNAEKAGTVRIVGRTVMDELAAGATGVNPWTGTPTNPAAPDRIPGGSSSGSAVAVAAGLADVGIGTDTGGSVRIPAGCCGVVGLKTGIGRIATAGVHPLSQTLDTIGPLARTVEDLVAGMALLESGFALPHQGAGTIGRIRLAGTEPVIDQAIDDAVAAAGLPIHDVEFEEWTTAHETAYTILIHEAWRNNAWLLDKDPDGVSRQLTAQLIAGGQITTGQLQAARRFRERWVDRMAAALQQVDLLCVPTLSTSPPLIADADAIDWATFARTMPVNLAGLPALALPVPLSGAAVPASLQLIGPLGSEGMLLRTGQHIERAVGLARAAGGQG